MTQTYVYNGKEVFLTGRKAYKEGRQGRQKVLYEVLPKKYIGVEVDSFIEPDWVRLTDLFAINDDK